MDLVSLFEAAQDADGVLDRGLVHEDGLEASLQGRVLLNVLAILVQGGGPDAVELATGQHGLEHVAGVHGRALGPAGAHDRVQLINEEDDLSPRLGDLLEDGLQPLLELAPVLGPGDERSQVQLGDALVLEPLGHVAPDDPLGQSLDDGCLAHARLAYQDRVVLGAPGEDLDDPPDLLVPADDRVQLPLAGQLGQVPSILLQGCVGALRRGAGDPLAAPDSHQGLEHNVAGDARLAQDALHGAAGMVEQGQEQVLGADVLVAELLDLVVGTHQHLAQPWRDPHLGHSAVDLGQSV